MNAIVDPRTHQVVEPLSSELLGLARAAALQQPWRIANGGATSSSPSPSQGAGAVGGGGAAATATATATATAARWGTEGDDPGQTLLSLRRVSLPPGSPVPLAGARTMGPRSASAAALLLSSHPPVVVVAAAAPAAAAAAAAAPPPPPNTTVKSALVRPRRSSPITTSGASSVSGGEEDGEERRVRARTVDEMLLTEDKRKGTWTAQEDELLRGLVMQHNSQHTNKIRWSLVAQHVPGRVGKQCRERWLNHLAPSVKKTTWSTEEDNKLLESHRMYGNQWSKISKLLEGRPENSVKNRFYSLTSRVFHGGHPHQAGETSMGSLMDISSSSPVPSPSHHPPLRQPLSSSSSSSNGVTRHFFRDD